MHSPTYSATPLASIERHLVRLEQMLELQNIAIAQLSDELAAAKRSNDWSQAQFGEMMRILARDLRELRAMLICSVVSDGPISAQAIQTLLRETSEDAREMEVASTRKRRHSN
jgi:esterase/lipase